jgi:two-component system, OmpR family, sensor histidine kinase CiaH
MFQSARIKLTAWYLAIIMVISVSFSLFVYRQIAFEVRRGLRTHAIRVIPFSAPFSLSVPSFEADLDQIYDEITHRILMQLVGVNMGIFVLSGMAGYFLAGKTLRPIEVMVDDQRRFVADASHELRTPLTAMKTEIEVALRDEKLGINDAKSLLRSNLEEVDHMQMLSNNLLSLTRYQHGNAERIAMESIRITDILEKALSGISHLAEEKDITVEPTITQARLKGNAVSLTELLTILLDNAIKYSHNHNKIIVTAKTTRKNVILTVQDFGIGMKKSEVPFIFNRFYRADSSRGKTTVDGYGLGLSIAKQIVDLHNGKIDIQSKVNKGTIFTVTLPLEKTKN